MRRAVEAEYKPTGDPKLVLGLLASTEAHAAMSSLLLLFMLASKAVYILLQLKFHLQCRHILDGNRMSTCANCRDRVL